MIDFWNKLDLYLYGHGLDGPEAWHNVGVSNLTWNGHWQMEIVGVLPEANF